MHVGGGELFPALQLAVMCGGGGVGGAGSQSKCEGDERGVEWEELNS